MLLNYTEANKYFVESIAKAYQALTDPLSRENFEKYGHPDGRQVIISYATESFVYLFHVITVLEGGFCISLSCLIFKN